MNQEIQVTDKRVLVRHYDDASELTVTTKRKWKHHKKIATEVSEQKDNVKASAISRAKATVRRNCLAIGADRMLTLTMPGETLYNVESIDIAWKRYKNFLQRMRRDGIKFGYVAVPEKQGRGAWHFHVAINIRLDAKQVRKHWTAVGGGKQIDLKPFVDRDYSSKTEGCAGYIAKYIGKDIESSEFNRNRYRCSKGIKIDIERIDTPPQAFTNEETIRETFKEFTGRNCGWINRYQQVISCSSWGYGYRDMRIHET